VKIIVKRKHWPEKRGTSLRGESREESRSGDGVKNTGIGDHSQKSKGEESLVAKQAKFAQNKKKKKQKQPRRL